MKLPMTSESTVPDLVRPFQVWRDGGTEHERLPAVARPASSTAVSQRGQTRVTFVENESTDDE
jgi:hypothetical protein